MINRYTEKQCWFNFEEVFTVIRRTPEDILDSQALSDQVERLKERDVHLWVINRNVYRDQKSYSKYFLSEDEQHRAQQFRFRRDRDLFVMGRHITRLLLAYYTGSTPDTVMIVPDASGKPSSDINVFFNISHSHDQLFLGFSDSVIGVDIEKKDPSVNIERIGESYFSEMEFQMMMKGTKDKRLDTFFEIWTKKESLIKGIGTGLGIPLQNFNVTDPNGKVRWGHPAEENYGDWYVRELEAHQGYKSAFATQNAAISLSHFCLNS